MIAPTQAPPFDEERLRAAIGPRADYYLRRWREMDAAGKSVSWNWAACFANMFWLAYRKMWAGAGRLHHRQYRGQRDRRGDPGAQSLSPVMLGLLDLRDRFLGQSPLSPADREAGGEPGRRPSACGRGAEPRRSLWASLWP